MNRILPFCLILVIGISSCNKSLTSEMLLEKSIAHHDPDNSWSSFNGAFNVTMKIPEQADRLSNIMIDLPNQHFYVKAKRDTLTTEYDVKKSECIIKFNGSSTFSEEDMKAHGLTCDRAKMYKNYYTYLYGLPMKLKDPGTHIDPIFEEKNFKGKDYLVLKATYDAEVGSDIWYFYFDPKTYAMEIYQFFKTDEEGQLNPESGEYILLSEEKIVSGVKMPKVRAWYYNKDDKFLGTDVLN